MNALSRLLAITLAGAAALVALASTALRALAQVSAVPSGAWGAAQLTDAMVLAVCTAGALAALWHVVSALLAALVLAGGAPTGRERRRLDPRSRTQALPAARSRAMGVPSSARTEWSAADRPRSEPVLVAISRALLERWGAPLVRRAAVGALAMGLSAAPALAAEAPVDSDLGWQPTTSTSAPAESTAPAGSTAAAAGSSTAAPAAAGSGTATAEAAGASTAGAEGAEGADVQSAPSGPVDPGLHEVTAGESLWSITADLLGPGATAAQVAEAWPELYDENRSQIGPDPDWVLAGSRLTVPSSVADTP